MKRFSLAVLFLAFTVMLFAQTYKDGLYFAQDTQYGNSGWKEQVVVEVKGGKIVSVNWNAVSNLGMPDKKTYASQGGYGMAQAAKQGEWHIQAKRVEDYLIHVQDPSKITYDATTGKTDVISGATIHVNSFVELVKKALASQPVKKGIYKKDGWFYAAAQEFDKSGWKETVLVTVVNGTIVDVVWNALPKDPKGKSKLVSSLAGAYPMNGAQGPWHVQAERMQKALLDKQNPALIAVKSDGKTDAVSGVSITVGSFLQLVSQALEKAK
ncbi:MAG TPA: FMN-binding protein [Spirochaetia bacterium]|nr:FMN-binding protein [Spirochaetales bacterium]HRS66128.1 FMN-binding protein [Spirochaetia bacterium]HOT60573.1 FMN-binding protein [Spirochaetales bacterium]HPD79482.1 FMN-binding protein [Spirochaetales bacterium]HQG39696.1 FMN-binding protein [Spirochaetales bacterium]